MSCTEIVCGTGGWSGPKPGDPDNNLYISARTVYGGINVNWSYPTTNGHAVSYYQVFRSTNANFLNAVELDKVTATTYFDKLDPATDTEYYYWIKMMSVHGTLYDPIGPASAIARPVGQQTIETLTELIDKGVLAQALKQDIDKITVNYQELLAEIAKRIQGDAALSAALALVQSGLQESLGLIYEERITRQEGQDALASQLLTVAAVNQQNAAAILTEQTARVTADSALATSIEEVRAATDTVASQAAAAVTNEATARTNADSALATQITTVQSTLNGNIASIQQTFETEITALDGVIQEIGALYTMRLSVNGLIGGFGVYNDGTFVEAGFDVDRFWIGRTNEDKVKPFIVDNGVVYINKARVRDADIDTLKIEGNAVTVPIVVNQASNVYWFGKYYDSVNAVWVGTDEWSGDGSTLFWKDVNLGLAVNFGTANLTNKCLLGFSFQANSGGGGAWAVKWRVVRDDAVIIKEGEFGVSNNTGGPTVSGTVFDGNTGNGFRYYKVQAAIFGNIIATYDPVLNNHVARSVSLGTFYALGAKR